MGEHTPCIDWTGYIDEDGYGRVSVAGKWCGAHRVAWEKANGPIPVGLTIDHLCRNRRCVNPDHLEPVTAAENSRRGRAAQTHCRRGHELSGDNLRAAPGEKRVCRACGQLRWREYRQRKIEAGTYVNRRVRRA